MRRKPFAAAPLTPIDHAPTTSDADHLGRTSTARRGTNPAERPILLSPRAVLSSFFSFEALLVLYMFAGLYKGDPRFAWIPVDPTALFFVLSVAVGSIIIVRKGIYKKGLPVVFVMGCLVAWFALSLVWSPSRIYGPQKVFFFGSLALWGLIAGALIVAPDPKRVRRLFTLMLMLALWAGVDAVLAYVESGGAIYRLRSLDDEGGRGGYLLLGRVCGPGALVALAGWLYSRGSLAGRLYLGLFLGLSFVLAIGGGRGPLLSTALPLLIPVCLSIRLPARKILASRRLLLVIVLPLVTAGGLALYATVTAQRLGTIDRLERLAEGNPRIAAYTTASEAWPQAPLFGHGAGSWPFLVGIPERNAYPHNMFLEIIVEAGIIGLILFLALVWTALRPVSLERLRRDPRALCAMMLFANTLLNAMTTSDLAGNRAMFMMLGVLALVAIRPLRISAPVPVSRQGAAPLDLPISRGRPAGAQRIR
jgi:O-antigen ligase